MRKQISHVLWHLHWLSHVWFSHICVLMFAVTTSAYVCSIFSDSIVSSNVTFFFCSFWVVSTTGVGMDGGVGRMGNISCFLDQHFMVRSISFVFGHLCSYLWLDVSSSVCLHIAHFYNRLRIDVPFGGEILCEFWITYPPFQHSALGGTVSDGNTGNWFFLERHKCRMSTFYLM